MSLPVRISGFIAFMALPQVLGYAAGSHIRRFAKSYYPELKKPFWAPPGALIGKLWTLMYLLNGLASYFVWRQKILNNVNVRIQIVLYCIQLFFNVNFAPLFFRVKSPLLALCAIFLNLIFASLTTLTFLAISPTAGLLMKPYLAFLVVSGYLCKRVWRLNQGRDLSSLGAQVAVQ